MKKFSIVSLLIACLICLSALQPAQANPTAADNAVYCPALPASNGRQVPVSTVGELVNAVNTASEGDVILLADGTYNLSGNYLWMDVAGVTLRSASGNREAVILDGNYATTEIITIARSNITIADITIQRAYTHPIHVVTSGSDTLNTKIYNVHIIDPGEQAIKINPGTSGGYPDAGEIACSTIELTDAGRPHIRNNCYTGGVDAHQARDWVIRDNTISGFWCSSGLSEHAIHFWRGCRDPIVQRNTLLDNARGVGFGLVTSGTARTYADDPCPETSGYVDHFGGVVKNNFLAANDNDLFASYYGFDCGICIWNACRVDVLHNSVYTANTGRTFSAIEWRFPNTSIDLYNNLVNDTLMRRDGASESRGGNIDSAAANWFVNAAAGDLHLVETATAAIDEVSPYSGVDVDIDGDSRPIGSNADVGADEYGIPAPNRVMDLRLQNTALDGQDFSFQLTWTEQNHTAATEIRYADAPINESNWNSAAVLVSDLAPGTTLFSDSVSYTEGHLYFALRAKNSEEAWSAVSNLAFWPHEDVFLPVIMR